MKKELTLEDNRKDLSLSSDIKIIKLKDGRNYSVRISRKRYFFPDEWKKFYNSIKDNIKPLFDFIFNTGCRYEEAIFIRPDDFDFERNNVRLWKTKTKAKKGETHGEPRTVSLSSSFTKRMKKYSNSFNKDEYIFKSSLQSVNQLLKRKLRELGVKDYYNFSSHNIRKTHGMYLKALGIDMGEICQRLGHDANTYIKHYGSADIFSDRDMALIKELIGDLYSRQRRF